METAQIQGDPPSGDGLYIRSVYDYLKQNKGNAEFNSDYETFSQKIQADKTYRFKIYNAVEKRRLNGAEPSFEYDNLSDFGSRLDAPPTPSVVIPQQTGDVSSSPDPAPQPNQPTSAFAGRIQDSLEQGLTEASPVPKSTVKLFDTSNALEKIEGGLKIQPLENDVNRNIFSSPMGIEGIMESKIKDENNNLEKVKANEQRIKESGGKTTIQRILDTPEYQSEKADLFDTQSKNIWELDWAGLNQEMRAVYQVQNKDGSEGPMVPGQPVQSTVDGSVKAVSRAKQFEVTNVLRESYMGYLSKSDPPKYTLYKTRIDEMLNTQTKAGLVADDKFESRFDFEVMQHGEDVLQAKLLELTKSGLKDFDGFQKKYDAIVALDADIERMKLTDVSVEKINDAADKRNVALNEMIASTNVNADDINQLNNVSRGLTTVNNMRIQKVREFETEYGAFTDYIKELEQGSKDATKATVDAGGDWATNHFVKSVAKTFRDTGESLFKSPALLGNPDEYGWTDKLYDWADNYNDAFWELPKSMQGMSLIEKDANGEMFMNPEMLPTRFGEGIGQLVQFMGVSRGATQIGARIGAKKALKKSLDTDGLYMSGANTVRRSAEMGGSFGIVGYGFAREATSLFDEALNVGMDYDDAQNFSILAGGLLAMSELFIREDKAFTSVKNAVKSRVLSDIANGVSYKQALARNFTDGSKLILGEGFIEEGGQYLLGQLSKQVANKVTGSNLDSAIKSEAYVENSVIGPLSASPLSLGSVRSRSTMEQQGLFMAARQHDKYVNAIADYGERGIIPDVQVKAMTKVVGDYAKIVDGIPATVSDASASRLAALIYDQQKMTERQKNAIIDPELQDQLGDPIQSEIDEIEAEKRGVIEFEQGRRDATVTYLQKVRKELGVDDESVFLDRSKRVTVTMGRIQADKPIDPVQARETSDYLYAKYKELQELKKNPTRMLTIAQINGYMKGLEIDIKKLENNNNETTPETNRQVASKKRSDRAVSTAEAAAKNTLPESNLTQNGKPIVPVDTASKNEQVATETKDPAPKPKKVTPVTDITSRAPKKRPVKIIPAGPPIIESVTEPVARQQQAKPVAAPSTQSEQTTQVAEATVQAPVAEKQKRSPRKQVASDPIVSFDSVVTGIQELDKSGTAKTDTAYKTATKAFQRAWAKVSPLKITPKQVRDLKSQLGVETSANIVSTIIKKAVSAGKTGAEIRQAVEDVTLNAEIKAGAKQELAKIKKQEIAQAEVAAKELADRKAESKRLANRTMSTTLAKQEAASKVSAAKKAAKTEKKTEAETAKTEKKPAAKKAAAKPKPKTESIKDPEFVVQANQDAANDTVVTTDPNPQKDAENRTVITNDRVRKATKAADEFNENDNVSNAAQAVLGYISDVFSGKRDDATTAFKMDPAFKSLMSEVYNKDTHTDIDGRLRKVVYDELRAALSMAKGMKQIKDAKGMKYSSLGSMGDFTTFMEQGGKFAIGMYNLLHAKGIKTLADFKTGSPYYHARFNKFVNDNNLDPQKAFAAFWAKAPKIKPRLSTTQAVIYENEVNDFFTFMNAQDRTFQAMLDYVNGRSILYQMSGANNSLYDVKPIGIALKKLAVVIEKTGSVSMGYDIIELESGAMDRRRSKTKPGDELIRDFAQPGAIDLFRKGLIVKLTNKIITLDQAKTDITEFIQKSFDAERLDVTTKREFNSLMAAIRNANSANTFRREANKVSQIIIKTDVRILQNKFDDLLGTKTKASSKTSTRPKGKIDIDTQELLGFVKSGVDLDITTNQIRIDQVKTDQQARNTPLTDIEISEIVGLEIANTYLVGTTSTGITAVMETQNAVNALSSIIESGREKFADELAKESAKYNLRLRLATKDVSARSYTKKQLLAREKRNQSIINRVIRSSRNFMDLNQALNGLVSIISKMDSRDVRGGNLQSMITNKIYESEDNHHRMLNDYEKLFERKLFDIFGKNYKDHIRRMGKKSLVIPGTLDPKTNLPYNLSQREAYYWYNQMQDSGNNPAFEKMFSDPDAVFDFLESNLDNRIKDWADWQVNEFFPVFYDRVNEVYRKIFRTNMPLRENYSGRVFRENQPAFDPATVFSPTHVSGGASGSSTKARSNNALAVKITDGDLALGTYIHDMSHFITHVENIRDIEKFTTHPDFVNRVKFNGDENAYRMMTDRIKLIKQRGVQQVAYASKILDNISRLFSTAKLSLNLTLYPKQAASFVAGIAYVPDSNFTGYMREMTKLFSNMPTAIRTWQEMVDNSQFLQNRYKGNMAGLFVALGEEYEKTIVPSKWKSAYDQFAHVTMFASRWGDKASAIIGFIPVYNMSIAKYTKQGLSIDAAKRRALRDVEYGVKNSLQSSSVVDKDAIQNSYGRIFTLFQSAGLAQFREATTSMRELSRALRGLPFKGTVKQNITRAVLFHSAMPMMFQWTANGMPGLLTDWDDEDSMDVLRAGLIGNLNSLFIAGSAIKYLVDVYQEKPYAEYELIPSVSLLGDFLKPLAEGDPLQLAVSGLELAGVPANNIKKITQNWIDVANGKYEDSGELILKVLGYSKYVTEGGGDKSTKRKKSSKPGKSAKPTKN